MKYEELKVDELRKLASKKGIKNSRRFKKMELIKVLQEYDEKQKVKENKSNKDKFINDAPLKTIVVFENNNKVRSAMMVERNIEKRELLVETKYGKKYYLSYDNILWVRTGLRYPRKIYNLMQGIKNE